jgi:hypothetical protein
MRDGNAVKLRLRDRELAMRNLKDAEDYWNVKKE